MMLFGSVGLGNKNVRMNSERASEREKGKESYESSAKRVLGQESLSKSPSPPFIEDVGKEVLFMPLGRVFICRNTTRGYK